MYPITIFTPSYNRAALLTRCYESLKKQTCKNFIWMVIDDGSTDHTVELVAEWQGKQCGFPIQYYYKENGGLHTAYNEAISHIDTPLCVCIDSDDFMPEDAVEQAVQVGPGQVPPVPAVGVQQPCGGVVECSAVGGKAAAALPRGCGQCTERCR